ncbi:hypothetical protein G8O29_06525 [Rhodobacter sp. M37P]|uniref:Uncharacterized protein n=1 Tax=Rhodobacter calidifons TaxID=2715277 RepID=A0ABX0G6A4_9RHOB|nr:hypothetical protein [Rhodobacter calidifons]
MRPDGGGDHRQPEHHKGRRYAGVAVRRIGAARIVVVPKATKPVRMNRAFGMFSPASSLTLRVIEE